jgi:hypothetical protein
MMVRCIDDIGASGITKGVVYQSTKDESVLPTKKNNFSRTIIIFNDSEFWAIYTESRFVDISIEREDKLNCLLECL